MSALVVALFFINAICPQDLLNRPDGLHHAARDGNVIHVQIILAIHPDRANSLKSWGKGIYPSPVHIAAEWNQVAVLKVLIAHGGDINDCGQAGATPLQLAAASGSLETGELLLKHGAILDIFSAAALNKREEVERSFRLVRTFGVTDWLANVRSQNPYGGQTPLLNWAVSRGHREMVEILLRNGASVNPFESPTGAYSRSPLHEAAEVDQPEVIELLLKHGAKLEAKDYDGFTPLHRAAVRGHIRLAKVLLKHGAKIDNRADFHAFRVCDSWNAGRLSMNTILHSTVARREPEMVAVLLAQGANPNARNADDQTPLDLVEAERKHPPTFDRDEYAREWERDSALCSALLYRYGGKRTPPGTPNQKQKQAGLFPATTFTFAPAK